MANSYDVNKDRYPVNIEPQWPARGAKIVTPSDTRDLTDPTGDAMPFYAKGLYIGAAGDVTVIMASSRDDSVTVLFKAVPLGTVLPIQVRRVMVTGTASTSITALFDC